VPTILFNGKTYNSIEEMPANERQAFEQLSSMFVDKNGNGIPDFLEGDLAQNVVNAFTSSININGKSYGSLNELPDDMRIRVQGAFEKMAGLGIVTKTTSPMMTQVNGMPMEQKAQAASNPLISQEFNPAIREEKGSNILPLALTGIVLLFCLAIAAFAVFYFMR